MANHQRRHSGRQPVETPVADLPVESPQDTAADSGNGQSSQSAQQNGQDGGQRPPKQPVTTLNINDLKDMSIQKLTQVAKDLNVAGATGMRKQDLIFQILKAQTEM